MNMGYEQSQGQGALEATGFASVEVAPDLAEVRLTALTEAATAAEATRRNAERLRDVLDAVEALPHLSVSTMGLSLEPIYTFDPSTGTSSITGYRAENSIEVETEVGDAGRIFDAGIAAGANVSSGITFRLADERPHREAAIQLAYRHAESDATALATAADVLLLGPEQLVVEPEHPGFRPRFELARSPDTPTPVVPGMLTVTATVRVRFGVHGQ